MGVHNCNVFRIEVSEDIYECQTKSPQLRNSSTVLMRSNEGHRNPVKQAPRLVRIDDSRNASTRTWIGTQHQYRLASGQL